MSWADLVRFARVGKVTEDRFGSSFVSPTRSSKARFCRSALVLSPILSASYAWHVLALWNRVRGLIDSNYGRKLPLNAGTRKVLTPKKTLAPEKC
jgi:hypothetical protein